MDVLGIVFGFDFVARARRRRSGDLALVVRSDRGTRRIHASNVTVRVTD